MCCENFSDHTLIRSCEFLEMIGLVARRQALRLLGSISPAVSSRFGKPGCEQASKRKYVIGICACVEIVCQHYRS